MVLQTFWLTMGEHYGTISDMNRCFTMENDGTFLWIYFELNGKLWYYIMDLLWIKTVQNNDTLPNTMMLNQKFWNLCWFTTENNILYHSINSVHFAIVLFDYERPMLYQEGLEFHIIHFQYNFLKKFVTIRCQRIIQLTYVQ